MKKRVLSAVFFLPLLYGHAVTQTVPDENASVVLERDPGYWGKSVPRPVPSIN